MTISPSNFIFDINVLICLSIPKEAGYSKILLRSMSLSIFKTWNKLMLRWQSLQINSFQIFINQKLLKNDILFRLKIIYVFATNYRIIELILKSVLPGGGLE